VSTLLNGCDPATATDLSGTNPTIDFPVGGSKYAPPCIKVAVGDKVTWDPGASSFTAHPLVGGAVENGAKVPDAASLIPKTTSGSAAVTVTFDAAGNYGYYCDFHALGGMTGAVFVE